VGVRSLFPILIVISASSGYRKVRENNEPEHRDGARTRSRDGCATTVTRRRCDGDQNSAAYAGEFFVGCHVHDFELLGMQRWIRAE
jgi:hypothetical protein